MNNFAINLARLRKQAGMSQYDLADELGIRQSTIGNIESGSRNPSWRLARRIAGYFNVSLAEMDAESEPVHA